MARTNPPKDQELAALEAGIAALSQSSQTWVHPIFKSLAELGGTGSPLAVEDLIRRSNTNTLKPEQWAHVVKNKWIRWTRNDLRELGALTGKKGAWEVTALGKRYWDKHRHDAEHPLDTWPSLSAEDMAMRDAPTESVEVTSLSGYFVPVLKLLASGPMVRRDINIKLEATLRANLLPGDYRTSSQDLIVYQYRTSWALTTLKLSGDVRSVTRGVWEITDAGRTRLQREEPDWRIENFHGSHAMVKIVGDHGSSGSGGPQPGPEFEDEDAAAQDWSLNNWTTAQHLLGAGIFAAADARLRPDLGAGPDIPLPRNIILFGPPGTGKTHAAMQIAQALTGEAEHSEEGRYRMVQFHPSYAYEDFVQGLRPDLNRATLRYSPKFGPLAEICNDAREDPERFFVLLIDEINRGDPARIFGEALFAIEHRGRPVGLAGGGTLVVPPNLVILGTMNSVDRSVALLDYALRRRFGFVYVAPDLPLLRRKYHDTPKIDLILAAVDKLNDWLRKRLGQEHVVGHSFFLNPAYPLDREENLARIWALDIQPLVAEYLVHDGDGLRDLTRAWHTWTAEIDGK